MRDFSGLKNFRVVQLDDVADVTGGKRLPAGRNLQLEKSENPYIRVADFPTGKIKVTTIQFIPADIAPTLKRYRVASGDLIISVAGTIGVVAQVPPELDGANLTENADRISNLRGVDPTYLLYVLRSAPVQGSLLASATTNAQPKLALERIRSVQFRLPEFPVQLRIAEILRTWDEAIEACGRLIEKKEERRDHLRRQLVSWTRWPRVPIGDVLNAVSRPVPTPTSAYKALSIRSHGKGTFHRLIERPEEIDMDTVYEVGPRDLIVNITFAWEGAIALTRPEDAGLYVSHRFPTFEVNEDAINRDFLGYAIRARRFFHNLGMASPGGAGRNRVLNKMDFLEIEIPLPHKSEQDRAASILLTADHELALLQAERDALTKQKRGLMQKLLTGERRVR